MESNSGFNSFVVRVCRLEQQRQSSSARHLKKLMRNLYWLAYPIHQFNTNIYSNTLKSIWWDCSMCVQVYKELNLDAAKKFLSAYESWWWNYRQMLLEDPQVPMIRCNWLEVVDAVEALVGWLHLQTVDVTYWLATFFLACFIYCIPTIQRGHSSIVFGFVD